MENNAIYDKLKKKIDTDVAALIAARETVKTRLNDLRKQVTDYRKKAVELAGELKQLEAQYPPLLVDSPKDVPALQKKIEKVQGEIKNQSNNADTLETMLPALEAELAKRADAVSSAVCKIVLSEIKEQSLVAADAFLRLFNVNFEWLQAVEQIRNETQAAGLEPLTSHRLHISSGVQKIPLKNRRFWHIFSERMTGDFSSLGSNRGDL